MTTPSPVERCALCAERAWRLAYALLRDAHEAFDAVQQAFLVAARKPGAVPASDPWPWFRVVVAHEAANLRRKRRPDVGLGEPGRGEPVTNPPDPRTPSPSDAAALAEEATRVAAAVDGLASPEREAVLLVHLGELSHAAAAEVLGVARQTVTERARRGVETLAARLGRGTDAAACSLLALPFVAPPKGLFAATQTWVHTATHGAAAGAGAATGSIPTFGGSAMALSKVGWSVGLLAAAGIGFFGGGATRGLGLFAPAEDVAGPGAPKAPTPLDVARTSERAHPELAGRPEPVEDASRALATLRLDNERLAQRVAELEGRLATGTAPSKSKGPAFTFGDSGRLDAIRDADWPALASASKVVGDSVVELLRHADAGTEPPKALFMRLQENVERVRAYEYRTIDKIPTAAPHNGELTHPITETNLIAASLEQAGKPLTPRQAAEFERLGLVFEDEFARMRAAWDASVPRARRVLEEMRAKGRFMDGLWATLTDDQKPVWIDPSLRGIAGVDLYDPTLMILHTSTVVTGANAGEMRPKLVALLRPKVGLAADAPATRVESLVDSFLARAAKGLEPVARARARYYTFAEAVAAGEASVELVDALLRDPDLSGELRRQLLDDPTWFVPRIVKS